MSVWSLRMALGGGTVTRGSQWVFPRLRLHLTTDAGQRGDSTPANTRAPVRQVLRVAALVGVWTTIPPTLLDLGYPLSHAHLVLPLRLFPFSRPQMKLESSGYF